MERIDEILPGIEIFLKETLAAEKLSVTTEKQRNFYIECITHAKAVSYVCANRGLPQIPLQSLSTAKQSPITDEQEENFYDPVEDSLNEHLRKTDVFVTEDFYENPETNTNNEFEDGSGSETSYESYSDDDSRIYANGDQFKLYVNEDLSSNKSNGFASGHQMKTSTEHLRSTSLKRVTKCGLLHLKRTFGWKKLNCYISEGCLVCYRLESHSKPLVILPLLGYDITYLDKESKKNFIIRISHAGCDSLIFAAESKQSATSWIEGMRAAASGNEVLLDESASQLSCSKDGSVTSLTQNTILDSILRVSENAERIKKKEDKSALSTFSGFIQTTFGRKQAYKICKNLNADALNLGSNVVIQGVLNVCQSPTKQKWRKCICTIIDGQFKVYREATAKAIPVLTFSLQSLEIQPASSDTKRSLAIKLMPADSGPILVEPSDIIEHGRWLSMLIREVGKASENGKDADQLSENARDEVDSDLYDDIERELKQLGTDFTFVPTEEKTDYLQPTFTPNLHNDEGRQCHKVYNDEARQCDKKSEASSSADDKCSAVIKNGQHSMTVEPSLDSVKTSVKSSTSSNEFPSAIMSENILYNKQSFERTLENGKPIKYKECSVTTDKKENKVKQQFTESLKQTQLEIKSVAAEELEELQHSRNPLLAELRRGKRLRGVNVNDSKALEDEIWKLQHQVFDLKKKWDQLRLDRLSAQPSSREYLGIDNELTKVENEIEDTECKLTKLQMNLNEVQSLSRKIGFQFASKVEAHKAIRSVSEHKATSSSYSEVPTRSVSAITAKCNRQ